MAGLDLQKLKGKTNDALAGFTSGQKAVMVVAAVGVVGGLMIFTRSQGGTSMAALYSNLSATDASAITAKLDSAGEKYRLSDGGSTILIPAKDVYAQRLKMSAADLPAGGAASFALLDKQGITTSQFRQRVDYQRALGGELGRTIAAMDGVSAAVVNLVIPPDDVFATDTQKATASVLIKTAAGTRLDDGKVQAIVNLVAQGVPGLTPDAISVTDQAGNQLWYPGKQADAALGGGDTALQRTQQFQNSLAKEIENLIVPVTGTGKVHVAVNAQLNFDKQARKETIYNNPTTNGQGLMLARDAQTEIYGAGAAVSAGVLGANANPSVINGTPTGTATLPTVSPTTTVAGAPTTTATIPVGGYTNVKDNASYAVNKLETELQAAQGSVERLGVSIVVDDKTVTDAAKAQIKNLVTPYLDTQRGDQLSIERMAFDTSAAATAAKALSSGSAATASSGGGLMGILKMVFTFLIIVVALFFAWRSTRKARSGDLTSTIDLRELEAVRQELRDLVPGAAGMALPSGAAGSDKALMPGTAGPVQEVWNLDPIPVSRTAALATQMETEISELVEQQPEDVAVLLRSWLSERRTARRN